MILDISVLFFREGKGKEGVRRPDGLDKIRDENLKKKIVSKKIIIVQYLQFSQDKDSDFYFFIYLVYYSASDDDDDEDE